MSYYYNKDDSEDLATAALVSNIAVIPITIVLTFSVQIAEMVSYRKLIPICSFLYPLSIKNKFKIKYLNETII